VNNICKYILAALLLVLSTLGVVTGSLSTAMKIHVYSDGSIVIDILHHDRVENTGVKEAYVQGNLDVGDDYYELAATLEVATFSTCTPDTCMYIEGSMITTTTSSSELFELTTMLVLNMWDSRGNALNVSVNPLNYKLNISSLRALLSGIVELSATGEPAQILEYASMLNKSTIEQILEEANITWITVNTFTSEINEHGKVKYTFELEINELELANMLGVNTTFIKEQYKTMPSTTSRVFFYSNTTNNYAEISLRVNKNINEHLEHMVDVYNEILTQIEIALQEISRTTGIELSIEGVKPVLAILEKFTDNFTILNSRGLFVLELKENTLTINITTPRLIKKNARTPADTLIALYNLAKDMQSELGIEELLNTTVYLIPENGLKITRNGTEVEQVSLGELAELEVTTLTPTPTPSLLEQIPLTHLAIVAGAVLVLAAVATLLARKR